MMKTSEQGDGHRYLARGPLVASIVERGASYTGTRHWVVDGVDGDYDDDEHNFYGTYITEDAAFQAAYNWIRRIV